MPFSKAQTEAIHLDKGPAIILAGPGSGKTTVITERVMYLTAVRNVPPGNILVITFTRLAAREMSGRFLKLSGQPQTLVTFSTFHSLFYTMLKHGRGITSKNIVSQEVQIAFIKDKLSEYELEITDIDEYASNILQCIGYVKNNRISPDKYVCPVCSSITFSNIYNSLSQMMKQKRLVDFDDLMLACFSMLKSNKQLLKAWQNKYRYILIDEFQDICPAQFEVIRLLVGSERNLFIVGDDDQSIYGFRGSKPDIMLSFKHLYPDCKRIDLNINYRCDAFITKAAMSLINHNKNRFLKKITASNENAGKVMVFHFETLEEEVTYVASLLSANNKCENSFSKNLVLFRTNAGNSAFLKELVKNEIPFKTRENIKNIYNHWIAQDIISYLKISLGGCKRSDYVRIINRPLRYLQRNSISDPVSFKYMKEYYANKEWMLKRIEDFEQDVIAIGKLSTYAAITYVRNIIGYDSYIRQYAKESRINAAELFEMLDEIQGSAKDYPDKENWFQFIQRYGDNIQEQKNLNMEAPYGQAVNGRTADAVNICTLHSCKGLEFENVYILDVIEGMMPYHKAVFENEIEEERRMFYVGMTRAKRKLILCTINQRYSKATKPSRFLSEIDASCTMVRKIGSIYKK